MKQYFLTSALFLAVFTTLNAHASDFNIIQKDGLIEIERDCVRPTPKIPIENATVYCIFDNNTSIIKKDDKEGLIDKDGNLIINIEYESILNIGSDVAEVMKDGKYGLINTKTGKLLTPIHFDDVSVLEQDRISVQQANNAGYVDSTGKVVIPLKYGNTFTFENGLAVVSNHGYFKDDTYRMGVIDLDGNEILPPIYRMIVIDNDRIVFKNESGLDGVTDLKGNVIIEPQYTNIGRFYDGYSMVSLMGRHDMVGYIDNDGKEIIEPQYADFATHFKINGEIRFTVAKNIGINTKWGVVDKNNNTIIDFKYRDLKPQHTEKLFIATDDNFSQFLLDGKGKVISKAYDDIIGFSNGTSYYKQSGSYGLIDSKGKPLTPAIYDDIKSQYSEDNKILYGHKIWQNNKVGFLSNTGVVTLPAIYDDIIASANSDVLYIKQEGLYGVTTLQGKIITHPTYTNISPLTGGYLKAKQDNQWYLINPKGKNLGKTSAPELEQ